MSGIYSDAIHGLGLEPSIAPRGPRLTPEMSQALDEEFEINVRKANFMVENANYTVDQAITFIRNQMMNKAYPRIIQEYATRPR